MIKIKGYITTRNVIDEEEEHFLDFDWGRDFCEEVFEDDEVSEHDESARDFYKYDMDHMREIVQWADQGRPFASIQHRFKKLKHPMEITRLAKFIKKCQQNYCPYLDFGTMSPKVVYIF